MFLLLENFRINSTLKKLILLLFLNLRSLIMPKSPPTTIIHETGGHMFDQRFKMFVSPFNTWGPYNAYFWGNHITSCHFLAIIFPYSQVFTQHCFLLTIDFLPCSKVYMPFFLFQQSIAAIGAQLQGALIFNNEVNIHFFGVFICCNVALYCCFHMGMGLDHMKHDEGPNSCFKYA